MIKKIVYTYFLLCGILAFGCGLQPKSATIPVPASYSESVVALPDSLATPEELALKNKLRLIILKNVVVIDNRLVLPLDKEYFIEQGIPGVYCDYVKISLEETNDDVERYQKERGIKIDVSEGIEELRKELFPGYAGPSGADSLRRE